MGRPLNSRYFGEPTSVEDNKIEVNFRATGETAAAGWIERQRGSDTFLCSDGTNSEVCRLVDKASGSLGEGEMNITAVLPNDSSVRIVKIAGRKMTANDGNMYGWDFGTAGGAEIAERTLSEIQPPLGDVVITDTTTTTTTITVTFNYDGSDSSDVTGYEYSVDQGTWTSLADSPLELTGLTAATEYEIRLRAVDNEGAGNITTTNVTTDAA